MARFYPVGMPEQARREYDSYLDSIEEVKKNNAHRITEIQAELLRKGYDTIYIARKICDSQCYIYVRASNRCMHGQTFIVGFINAASIDKFGVKHLIWDIERLSGRR